MATATMRLSASHRAASKTERPVSKLFSITFELSSGHRIFLAGLLIFGGTLQCFIFTVPLYMETLWRTLTQREMVNGTFRAYLDPGILQCLMIYVFLAGIEPYLLNALRGFWVGVFEDRFRTGIRTRCAGHLTSQGIRTMSEHKNTFMQGCQAIGDIMIISVTDSITFLRGVAWICLLAIWVPWWYTTMFIVGGIVIMLSVYGLNQLLREKANRRQALENEFWKVLYEGFDNPARFRQNGMSVLSVLSKEQVKVGSFVAGIRETGYGLARWIQVTVIGGLIVLLAFKSGIATDGTLMKLITLLPQAAAPFEVIAVILQLILMRGAWLMGLVRLIDEAGPLKKVRT